MDGPDFEVAAKTRDAASYVAPTPDDDDDLLGEFIAVTANVKRRDFDGLEALGVPHDYLWGGPMRFGVAVVEPDGEGGYQPVDGGGELAYVMPAVPLSAMNHDVGDLIAFKLVGPGRWLRRTGLVPIMNEPAILRAEVMREPLHLFSTPLAWLKNRGQGVVILDWSVNLRLRFGGDFDILADTQQLGERFQRHLIERPVASRIFVRKAA